MKAIDGHSMPLRRFVIEAPNPESLNYRLRRLSAAISIRKGEICAVTHSSTNSKVSAVVLYRVPSDASDVVGRARPSGVRSLR